MSEANISNVELFNTLVSGDVSNIEDLPDYINPVPGTYAVRVVKSEAVVDDENDKAYIGMGYTLSHVLEVANPADADTAGAYAEGSPISERFYGEFGVKKFKKCFAQPMEAMNCQSIAEFLEQADGADLVVTISNRKDKEDPTKVYSETRLAVLA